MAEVLTQFLDPAYRYEFWRNPDTVRTKEDARNLGINCVSLAHLALKEMFDYELPAELGCAELYLDRDHFRAVEDHEQMAAGDLVWFGRQDAPYHPEEVLLQYDDQGNLVNWREFPVKHVTIFTGETDESADPLLLHATYLDGGQNRIWPMSRFADYHRYRKLYGITRLLRTE